MNHHDFATGVCSCGITKAAYDADQTISGECRFGPPGGMIADPTFAVAPDIRTSDVQAAVDANIRDISATASLRASTALEVAQDIIRNTILTNLTSAERLNLIEDLLCLVCGECGELLPPGNGSCACKSIPARLIR